MFVWSFRLGYEQCVLGVLLAAPWPAKGAHVDVQCLRRYESAC